MTIIQIILLVGLTYSINKLLHAIIECVKTKLTVKVRMVNMAKEMNQIILTWDRKEDIPLYEVNDAITKVFNKKECPGFHIVDTGSDTCAVVITESRISVGEAQEIWDNWMKEKSIIEGGK